MDRRDFPDEYEVSPLFEYGRFVCDVCKGTLGLTHEHVERLINHGPLVCIRCTTALAIEEQSRLDLKTVFTRITIRRVIKTFLGVFLIPLNVCLTFLNGVVMLNFALLALGALVYVLIRLSEKEEPEVYVSLKKRTQPEIKPRYRRQWRLK